MQPIWYFMRLRIKTLLVHPLTQRHSDFCPLGSDTCCWCSMRLGTSPRLSMLSTSSVR